MKQLTVWLWRMPSAAPIPASRGLILPGVLALAAWLCPPATTMAEVRLVTDAGDARVVTTPTPRGPWTLVGTLDPWVLNPAGDVLGDGSPTAVDIAGEPVVLWHRPMAGRLLAFRGSAGGWRSVASLHAERVIGTPRLIGAEVPLAAWQEMSDDGSRNVRIARLQSGAESARIADAWLVHAWSVGRTAFVALVQSDGAGGHELVFSIISPPQEPPEIPPLARVDSLPEGAWLKSVAEFAVRPIGRSGLRPASIAEWPADGATKRFVVLGEDGLLSGVLESVETSAGGAVRPAPVGTLARP